MHGCQPGLFNVVLVKHTKHLTYDQTPWCGTCPGDSHVERDEERGDEDLGRHECPVEVHAWLDDDEAEWKDTDGHTDHAPGLVLDELVLVVTVLEQQTFYTVACLIDIKILQIVNISVYVDYAQFMQASVVEGLMNI